MNIITIDLEEWHTYEIFKKGDFEYFDPILNKVLDDVLETFSKNNIKATFFCLGVIARKNKEIIKKIVNAGHEIGCHSDKHYFVNKMTFKQFSEDTKLAISSLEDLIGSKVIAYRAPAFSIDQSTPWALDVLCDNGIEVDCSIFPATRSYGGIKDLDLGTPFLLRNKNVVIKELPINYGKLLGRKIIFSGGGYFRLLPLNLIISLSKNSPYNMFYFHLRDFDKKQVKVYNSRFFMNYYGIDSSLKKFNRLSEELDFTPLSKALSEISWSKNYNLG